MAESPPDCLRCGACCHSPSERFVRVTGVDWARLGDAAERVAHFTGRGNEAYMKMTAGHCIALEIRPGPHTSAPSTPAARKSVATSPAGRRSATGSAR